jgi:hypothetical protein
VNTAKVVAVAVEVAAAGSAENALSKESPRHQHRAASRAIIDPQLLTLLLHPMRRRSK